VTPEQRKRAGRAIAVRIEETHTTPAAIARAAGVDPKTVRSLIRGDHWPTDDVQERLEKALDWQPGQIHMCSVRDAPAGAIDNLTDAELAVELARRLTDRRRREVRGTKAPGQGERSTTKRGR
jgi:predicted transcriptional regulator